MSVVLCPPTYLPGMLDDGCCATLLCLFVSLRFRLFVSLYGRTDVRTVTFIFENVVPR